MKQEYTTLETFCKEDKYHNHNDDTEEDIMLPVKSNTDTSCKSFVKMTDFFMTTAKKIHTRIVVSLQAELHALQSCTASADFLYLQAQAKQISKDELKRIQSQLQKKGITTQFAAEQELCEIILHKREKSGDIVRHPRSHIRWSVGGNAECEELIGWKKLGSLPSNHGAEKPIYTRESARMIQMLQGLDSFESQKVSFKREIPVRQTERETSAWMLEESAVRSPWDKH